MQPQQPLKCTLSSVEVLAHQRSKTLLSNQSAMCRSELPGQLFSGPRTVHHCHPGRTGTPHYLVLKTESMAWQGRRPRCALSCVHATPNVHVNCKSQHLAMTSGTLMRVDGSLLDYICRNRQLTVLALQWHSLGLSSQLSIWNCTGYIY